NTDEVLSRSLPFRQQNIAFRRIFPGLTDPIVIVLDGANPDVVAEAGNQLTQRLRTMPDVFTSVLDPASELFFRRNGCLYRRPDASSERSTASPRICASSATACVCG